MHFAAQILGVCLFVARCQQPARTAEIGFTSRCHDQCSLGGGEASQGITLLQGITNRGVVASQNAHASLTMDGQSVRISFTHDSNSYRYELAAYNVYADGATILRHTEEGIEHSAPGLSRTFRTRAPGKWASATVHTDGSLSGLFEDEGHVFEVQPADDHVPGTATPSMLQTGFSHNIRRVDTLELLDGLQRFAQANVNLEGAGQSPYRAATDDGSHFQWATGPSARANASIPMLDSDQRSADLTTGAWGGIHWYPGCYPGDSELHTFVVGFIADVPAHNKYGDSLGTMMESILSHASFVYEMQLNIRLEIGYLKTYTTTNGVPSWASGCDGSDFMNDKFQALTRDTDAYPLQGAVHLFTGCGTGTGTVGKAWVGSMCDSRGFACGINQIHGPNAWLTWAHELGHNFNGDHSFEQGQGETGGIMDYGDGTLDGLYQFNTQYRKTEMCKAMSSSVANCGGKFIVAPTTPSTPHFTPVDGGHDRACRGASDADNLPKYYTVAAASSLGACKDKCQATFGCQGVEYHSSSSRCELWTREGGIGASVARSGFNCFRLHGPSGFEPVDGGNERACRGANADDNSDDYYTVVPNGASSLDACKDQCKSISGCRGLEFRASGGRCEVWTRASGIAASVQAPGFVCLRFGGAPVTTFSPVDGGNGRACRGASASDNLAIYYTLVNGGAPSLDACRDHCKQMPGCKGVEYRSSGGRCEVWTRDEGIGASVGMPGFTCLRYQESSPDPTPSPTPSPTPAPTPTPSASSTGRDQVSEMEWQHFEVLNDLRRTGFTCPDGTSYGPNSEPLQFDCRLWKASYAHSQDMADNNYFSHTSQDGRSPWDRAGAQGISANGENIAAGRSSPQGVLDQWQKSNGHCRNMMSPNMKLFAVGHAFSASSRFGHYWTQMLKSSIVALESSCHPFAGRSSQRIADEVIQTFSEALGQPWYSDKVIAR